jgi:hypothetical protein
MQGMAANRTAAMHTRTVHIRVFVFIADSSYHLPGTFFG